MAIPAPGTSNLELRMNNRGRLEAFWKGDRLPAIEVNVNNVKGERAEISLRFVGLQVKLSTETAPEDNTLPPPSIHRTVCLT